MPTELRWIVSQSAACFYVADLLRGGRICCDAGLRAAIAEPAELLRQELRGAGLPEDLLFGHLVPLSARFENNRELAEAALRKAVGPGPRLQGLVGPLAGRIADLEAAARRAAPALVDELSAAAAPLNEAWDVHGAALLAEIGRLTDDRALVENADLLVVPATPQGGGAAYELYNTLSIEAMPADPRPELPEVVRIAWLVSQLNVDLPLFGESIDVARRPRIGALAMLPAALAAAESLELGPPAAETIELAVEAWGLADWCGAESRELARQWWATCEESRAPWPIALAALDRMLQEGGPPSNP